MGARRSGGGVCELRPSCNQEIQLHALLDLISLWLSQATEGLGLTSLGSQVLSTHLGLVLEVTAGYPEDSSVRESIGEDDIQKPK